MKKYFRINSVFLKVFLSIFFLLAYCPIGFSITDQLLEKFKKGFSLYEEGDYYHAKVILEEVLYEFRKNETDSLQMEADLLMKIAACYAALTDNVSEQKYLDATLKIYCNLYGDESNEYALAIHDLALSFGECNQFDKSIELLQQSISIYNKSKSNEFPIALASNYVALGWVYRAKGDYKKAIQYLEDAKSINIDTQDERFVSIASINHILGYTQMYGGFYNEGLKNLIIGKEMRRSQLGEHHPKYYQSLLKISECLMFMNDYKQALLYVDTVLNDFLKVRNELVEETSIIESVKSWSTLLDAFLVKGNILGQIYTKRGNDVIALNERFKLYKEGVDLLQEIMMKYPNDEGRFILCKRYQFLFTSAINCAYLIYERSGDEKIFKEAFDISEKSRSFIFRELHHKSAIADKFDIPDSLILLEKKLTAQRKAIPTQNDSDLESNDKGWIENNLKYVQLNKLINEQYPQYYFFEGSMNLAAFNELQVELVQEDKTLIEYFIDEWYVYIFVLGKDKYIFKRFEYDKSFIQILERTINYIKQNPLEQGFNLQELKEFQSNSFYLYNKLIQPLESLLSKDDHLIIIPHKQLNYLPFEVLVTDTIEKSIKNIKYLLNEYTISYNYSSAMVKYNNKSNTKSKGIYVGFAPGIKTGKVANDESFQEIASTAKIWKGQSYIGKRATSDHLIQSFGRAAILHIAAHSSIDNLYAERFAFLFNKEKSREKRDSVFLNQIYMSNLSAQLVILSGCQTADGPIKEGEGILSLAHAFLYAGAKGLTCSLWKTENSVSNQIITDYNNELQQGKSKDESLRRAKIHFLKRNDDLLSLPFFWSPFINIGNQYPIEMENCIFCDSFSKKWKSGLIILLIFLAPLIISLILFKKKGNLLESRGIKR